MLRFHLIAGEKLDRGSVEFPASDVTHALAIAYQLAEGRTFELWQGERKICAFDARSGVVRIGAGGSPYFKEVIRHD
jgi:hypothetical protein